MRVPSFLRFLFPTLHRSFEDREVVSGHLLVEHTSKGRRTIVYDGPNFVLDLGLSSARDVLIGVAGGGFVGSIFRMAIGDGGCPAGQLQSPKQPDGSWPARTGLYHEVIRQDIATFTRPTSTSARFIAAFNSVDVDASSFSLYDLVINEAALIIGDGVLVVGGDKKQINKSSPDTLDADERAFSARCFNSVPFDPSDNSTITVTWTINLVR